MSKKMLKKLSLDKETPQTSAFGHRTVSQPSKPVEDGIMRLILERASGLKRLGSFGIAGDVEAIGFESLLPSLVKSEIPDQQPKIEIGSPQCKVPYYASVLNSSALSFGPIGKNFILALNRAARLGEFYQNTGEAGLSPYHFGVDADIESPDFDLDGFFEDLKQGKYKELETAGDLVWQLGTGYFGCRRIDGSFDPEQFQKKSSLSNVKMIEVKLSQGVEPYKKMPVKKVSAGIAQIMGIRDQNEAVLKDDHSAFSSPLELLKFVRQLRTLSAGKPVGIKIGISHRQYFLAICKAMLKTGILLDFITVDGMEAGTAAASQSALGFTGTSLNDSILFIHNALVGTHLRKHIKIIASGKIFIEQDIVAKLARGADLCATARGMMISTGCDQQQECYNGNCHRGIATQDPHLLKNFNIKQNVRRAYYYHRITLEGLLELLSIAGVSHPSQLGPFHMQKRISVSDVKPLDEIYEFIPPGSLLRPWRIPRSFRKVWSMARPDATFIKMTEQISRITNRHSWR